MVLQIEPRSRRKDPAAASRDKSSREKRRTASRPRVIEPPELPGGLIAPWQAWTLALWMAVVAGVYLISMLS